MDTIQQDIELSQEEDEGNKKNVHPDFILIKKDTIQSISVGLANKLQISPALLIGTQFSAIVNKTFLTMMSGRAKQFERQSIHLALMIGAKMYILQSKLYVIPAQDKGVKHLYLLDKDETNASAFLYDFRNDHIICFSTQAFNNHPFLNKANLEGENIFSSNIFELHLYSAEILKALESGNQVKTHFKKISSYKNSNRTINLKLLQSYKHLKQHLMIISINRQQENSLMQPTSQSLQSKSLLNPTQKSHQQQSNLMNQTFCPIENHYKQKLVSKLVEKRFKKGTRTVRLSIVVGLVLLAIFSCLTISLLTVNTLNEWYKSLLALSSQLTSEYGNIMLIFYFSFIKYHIRSYPESVLSFSSTLNITQLSQFYSSLIQVRIDELLPQHFSNPYAKQKPYIEYQIQFLNYNSTLNSQQISNIMNLFVEAKQFMVSNNITFLVNNYEAYRNLEASYRIDNIYNKQLQRHQQEFVIFTSLSISIVVLLLAATFYLLTQFALNNTNIYQLPTRITPQQLEPLLKNIKDRRQELTILKYRPAKWEQNDEVIDGKDALRKEKKLVGQGLVVHVKKGWLIYLLVILFVVIVTQHSRLIKKQGQDFINIYNFLLQIQSAQTEVINDILIVLHNTVANDINPTTTTIQHPTVVELNIYFKDDTLPDFFVEFRKKIKDMLFGNLCKYYYLNNVPLLQNVKCELVQQNILSYGFWVAFQRYRHIILEQILGVPLSQLFLQNTQLYPPYLEIVYIRRILMEILLLVKAQFIQQTSNYLESNNQQKRTLYMVGYFCIGMVMVVSVRWMIVRLRQSKDVVCFIKSMPKATLFDIKNTKHLNSIRLIQNLSEL